jgi:hypothetical protein
MDAALWRTSDRQLIDAAARPTSARAPLLPCGVLFSAHVEHKRAAVTRGGDARR